jgi:hypothetical protein
MNPIGGWLRWRHQHWAVSELGGLRILGQLVATPTSYGHDTNYSLTGNLGLRDTDGKVASEVALSQSFSKSFRGSQSAVWRAEIFPFSRAQPVISGKLNREQISGKQPC